MKIYSQSMYGNGMIFVTPGKDHPETSEWVRVDRDADGRETRTPIQFAVQFKAGMAVVPSSLGRYMIAHKLASASPLVVPEPPLLVRAEPMRYAKPIAVGEPRRVPEAAA